jgi:hypothetical protein
MNLFVAASVAGALLLPIAAHAESPFDGTWKGASGPAITLKVTGDTVTRSYSTGRTLNLKTDGSFTPVKGMRGFTALSTRLKDDHTIEDVSKRGGKIVGRLTSTVSEDGKTMTVVYVDERTHHTTTYKAKKL